jgi:hypothetical protein
MRTLGRLLLWLSWSMLAIACVAWVLPTWKRLSALQASNADEKPLIFFAAGDSGQLRFNVAGHGGWFALYPALTLKRASSPDYRVRLQVLDGSDKLLLEEVRHISHPQRFFEGLADGRTSWGQSVPVRRSATQWLDLSPYPSAHAVDVAVLPEHEGDADRPVVYWRGFLTRSLDDREAQARYRQLSRRARAELSEAFITPPGLLPEAVQLDLSRRRFEPSPPLGDHQEATLYMRKMRNQVAEESRTVVQRAGWPIAPDLPATMHLDDATEIELEAYDQQGRPMAVSMDWREGGTERHRPWPATPSGPPARAVLPKGTFEFHSQHPGVLRVRGHADGRLLLPDMLRLPVFEIAKATPLDYSVHPLPGRPTRVRLDLRPLDGNTRFRLLPRSGDGASTSSEERTITAHRSRYERFARAPDTAAPVASSWVVDLPASALGFRLESDAPALVTAYVEGVGRGRIAGSAPRWFHFLPDNRVRLQQQFVYKQPDRSPAAPRGTADSGTARFVLIKPEGLVMSQLFLMPEASTPATGDTEPGMPGRLRSLGSGTLRISVEPGRTPRLAWLGARKTPTTASITVDATTVAIPVAGGSGLVGLPPLAPGVHTLRVNDAAGARWMVSGAAASDWRLRRLWSLSDRQPWTLRVRREGRGRESLQLLVFTPPGVQSPRFTAEFPVDGQAVAVVAAERIAARRPPTEAWPMWQRADAWHGPERWSIEVPDALPAGRDIRVRLRCSGCRDIRALAFRMSEVPAPRQLHARAGERNDDAQ